MKRINILLGGQGHGLMIKPITTTKTEILKYGQRYVPRVYKRQHPDAAGNMVAELFELYAWDQIPDIGIEALAVASINRGFVSEC